MFRGERKTRWMRGRWEEKEWEAGRWEGRKGAARWEGRGRARDGSRCGCPPCSGTGKETVQRKGLSPASNWPQPLYNIK